MLDDVRVRIALGGIGILLYIACLLVVFLRNPAAYLDIFAGLCDRAGIRTRANDAPEAAGRQQSRVTKAVGELRVQYFPGTAQLWMHIVAARMIYTFGTDLIGLETLGRGSGYAGFALVILYLCSLVLTLRPGLVNSRTLPFLFYLCHGLMMCLGVLAATTHASIFVRHQSPLLLIRMSISLAYPVASPNACVNAVWVVLSTYAHLRTEPVHLLEQFVDRIVSEILINGFLSYWLWQFESLQTGQVRSESKATMYFTAKKTMERLLADMCDAVVELGPELEIKEPCPKLASLLLRHGNATALAGEQFTNLTFGKEDQDHFEEFVVQRTVPVEIDESAMENERTSSLHLHLKDAYNTPVAVQLFHSCHVTSEDDICHIVGVHEVERGNGTANAEDALGAMGVNANVGDGGDDAISEASVGTSRASGDLNMVLAPLIQEGEFVGPVTLLLDPLSMVILGCTVGLKSLLGPLWFKGPVKDCIANYVKFCAWLHKAVNEELCGDAQGSEFQLRQTPPLCKKQASFEFQADARVICVEEGVQASHMGMELPPGCNDEHYEMLCLLELQNSQPKWLRSKRKSRTRRSNVEADSTLGKASF